MTFLDLDHSLKSQNAKLFRRDHLVKTWQYQFSFSDTEEIEGVKTHLCCPRI